MSAPQQPQINMNKRPFLRLLGAQLGAGVLLALIEAAFAARTALGLEIWVLVGLQGVLAAIISVFLGLNRGWVLAQMILPWATWGALYFDIPAWVYLVCFILTYGLYKNVGSERVPLYLSNGTTWQALSELLDKQQSGENTKFIDLGSGLGGTVAYLGKNNALWQCQGIESAPLAFAISWLRIFFSANKNSAIKFGSMWNVNLAEFDVVYAFLSPAPMARLLEKAKAEMAPGSLFISNSFWEGENGYDEIMELSDRRSTKLFIKKM